MRIDSSIIGMESARRYTSSKTQYSRFVLKDYHGGKTQADTSLLGEDLQKDEQETQGTPNAPITTKDYAQKLQEQVEGMRRNRVSLRSSTEQVANQFRHYTTRYIFMLLFGEEKTKEFLGDEEVPKVSAQTNLATLEYTPMKTVSFTSQTQYMECEEVTFSSIGKVTTADGKEICFSLEVGMSHAFYQYYEEEYSITQFQRVCDPLVINFDTDVASLSDQKVFFDIDADGEEDEVSMLGSGSGYLALDQNGDGTINDGSELFGPQSGNGFADLAVYDEDQNGWIDENDSVWNKLLIRCQDTNGRELLYTLKEKGVGAICLQNTGTEFALNNAENVSNGYLRSTGIFLYENGMAGTVQHLDLVQ